MGTSHTHSTLFHMGGVPVIGGALPVPPAGGNVWFVDGSNGLDGNDGKSSSQAVATIGEAVDRAAQGDSILVYPIEMAATDTDPGSYDETIELTVPGVSIIGVSRGRTQGGLPQMKIGAGTTPMITVSAPGCYIGGIGINGAGSTGGGILINDDGGSTAAVIGLTIENCHFKNCKCHATNGSLGGAIYWGANGAGWQVLIRGNKFYKNVADIVLVGTSVSVPQDVVIEDNIFSGPAASVDINLFLKGGGSGMNGVYINRNVFPCFPAISSGTNATIMNLTGCVGTLTNNTFGCTGKTFGAAANVIVPATVLMANNYQEDGTTQIART